MTTEARADALSDMPKVITEDWRWQYMERKNRYEGEVSVTCVDENTTLRLVGWINRRLSYSFSILHKGSIPIRRWGDHLGHKNPDNTPVNGPHKHKWRDDVEDGFVYPTDDVSTSSVDQAFLDFCDEENIDHNAKYYGFEGSRLDDWM